MFGGRGIVVQHLYRTEPEAFNKLAELLKALAHPQRLCIVKTLCEKKHSNVTDMQNCLGEAQSTVSQHFGQTEVSQDYCRKKRRNQHLLFPL